MVRIMASLVFMAALPMMAVTGAVLMRASRAARWVRHVVWDHQNAASHGPWQPPGRKLWQEPKDPHDTPPPWL